MLERFTVLTGLSVGDAQNVYTTLLRFSSRPVSILTLRAWLMYYKVEAVIAQDIAYSVACEMPELVDPRSMIVVSQASLQRLVDLGLRKGDEDMLGVFYREYAISCNVSGKSFYEYEKELRDYNARHENI